MYHLSDKYIIWIILQELMRAQDLYVRPEIVRRKIETWNMKR